MRTFFSVIQPTGCQSSIQLLFSSQTLLNKYRQCCESCSNVELGVRAVCAVDDTTDEDRWVDLRCCSPHDDTAERCLTNDTLTTFSSSSDCYDDWRRPSPTVRQSYDASSPFRRCRLLRSCYNASAAHRLLLAASYIFCDILGSILCSRFLFPPSIFLDTVLSHNYRSTPVIKLIFWFQSCLLIISRFPHRLTAESTIRGESDP